MALNEIGTAYVIIKANTEQLAGDIGKGFSKGVKDADSEISKSGEDTGGSFKKGFAKDVGDGELGDGVIEGLDTPELHKKAERTGAGVSKSVKKGSDDETKRRNPFSALGDAFTGVFKDIGTLKPVWIALLAPDVLGGLANLIGVALAGVAEAAGFLVTAAAGAGVALVGMAVVALPALGLLLAAFKVETEELKAFKEQAQPLAEAWKNVAVAVQKRVLPAMIGFLENTQILIPMFVEFGDHVGTIAGNFVTMAGNVLTSNKNLDAMGTILENSEGFFRAISEAALLAFDALIPLFAEMAPLGVQLAESLRGMAEHLQTFLAQPGKLDELGDKFQLWYDRLTQVGRIIGDLFIGLWNVLGIGAEFGTNMFDSLEKIAGKWREWTGSIEGTNALKKWFEDAQPLMHEAWLLLKDIGEIVLGPIITGDNQGTTDFIHTIRTDWLPVFKDLADAVSGTGFGDALVKLAGALVDLIGSFAGSSTMVETIDALTSVIETFAKMLSSPVVAAITPTIATLAGAFFVLKLALPTSLIKAVWAITEALLGMAGVEVTLAGVTAVLAPFALAVLAVAAAVAAIWAVWHFWDQIVGGLAAAWEWFTKLNTPLKILVGTLAVFAALGLGPILLIPATLLAIVAAFKNWDKIVDVVGRVWDSLFGFFTGIPDLIAGIPDLLGKVFDSIVDFFADLPSKVGDVGGLIKDAILSGLQNLPSLILDTLGELGTLGQKILGLIADGLAVALPALAQFFIELPFKMIDWIGQAAVAIIGVGVQLLAWIAEGLVKAIPKVLTFMIQLPFEIGTLIRKGLVELIKLGVDMIVALVKGFIKAWPEILQWFKDLPGNILRGVVGAASWLISVGNDIVHGIWQGLQNGWDMVVSFFIGLPGRLLGYLSGAGGWLVDIGAQLLNGLWQGIQSVWGSIDEFFVGLPQMMVDLIVAGAEILASVGSQIPGWIVGGITAAAQLLWDWFTGLPQLALDTITGVASTIMDIGKSVVGWIVDGLVAVAQQLWDWFTDLPGLAFSTISAISDKIMEIGRGVIGWIIDGLVADAQLLWDWFTELPGAAWDALNAISEDIVNIGKDIVGWIIDGLVGLADMLWTTIKEAMPSIDDIMGVMSSLVTSAIDKLPGGHFIRNLFAMGGIIPGSALGTPVTVGEGFRSEAIVPIERPSRALAVMQTAGLDRLVLDAYLGGSVPGQTSNGDVTMLHIDHALINEPVNADMLVQKIATAYHRMAS